MYGVFVDASDTSLLSRSLARWLFATAANSTPVVLTRCGKWEGGNGWESLKKGTNFVTRRS